MPTIIYHFFSITLITVITTVAYRYSNNKKKVMLFPTASILWLFTVYIIGETNFYINFDFPPRFVIFGILPSFLLLASFTFSTSGRNLMNTIPIHFPIFFQSFRIIVELLILWCYFEGIGPKAATFMGYNYEFYFGISALLVGVLAFKKRLKSIHLLLWNSIGLFMLAFIVGIFFTSVFAHETIWGSPTRTVSDLFMKMPYISIAVFYMPLAVWMHIFSIQQVKILRKTE